MRKIILSMLLLWISNTAFSQSMDWSFYASYPGVTYVDDTKLVCESSDGVVTATYELISLGYMNILTYDIIANPMFGSTIDYIDYYAFAENRPTEGQTELLWTFTGLPSGSSGPYYFSGDTVLDSENPMSIFLGAEVQTNYELSGSSGLGVMYYPN